MALQEGAIVAGQVGGDGSTDPYAGTGFEAGGGRITQRDTNPNARDSAYWRQNIVNSFLDFGYYPTEAEVSELIPSSAGTGGEQTGRSAVGNYVSQQKAEILRQQNDPLAALQKKMTESADLMKAQVNGLYGQLQDTLSSAPQLFGNMTPDQINTYLAPLQDSFKQQLSLVQGTIASRGLAASSTENNALAQTDQQFKNQVFSTGLDVGMKSQQAKAQAIQSQIASLLGLTGQEESLASGAAGQRSGQNLGQSNMIQSLPFFLDQAALQTQLINKRLNPGGDFQNTFNQVTGDINQGIGALQSLQMIPQQFKTVSSPGSGGAGGTPYASPSTFQSPADAPNSATAADQLPALFATA